MPTLQVDGAVLYYETFGSGPLLVLIPGAEGRGSIFHEVAKRLSSHFTVACWDRRGYSQSLLVGTQDFANRLSTDADDAHLLIKHLSPDPAIVFGSSSGAVVAQRLLERHPGSVKQLISHEPPSLPVLPDEFRVQGAGLFQQVYDTYRAHGPAEAINVFASGFGEGEDGLMMRFCMDPKRGDEIRANVMFWFEFELRQYTSEPVNLEVLGAEKEKYVPMAGVESGNGPGVAPISLIAQKLGKEVVRVPGGHIGYMTATEAFADALLKLLK